MKRNLVLTIAQGRFLGARDYEGVGLNEAAPLCLFRSYEKFRAEFDLVVLAKDVSREYIDAAERANAEIVFLDGTFNDPGNKQRHWHYAEFLNSRPGTWDQVLTIDARDTIFLRNPFYLWLDEAKIHMSGEGGFVENHPWNKADQGVFQETLRPTCRHENWPKWLTVNGGFVTGSQEDMINFSLLRLALDVRGGQGTDQASLTAFAAWVEDFKFYRVVPMSYAQWIFHGEWEKQWLAKGLLTYEGCVPQYSGKPYAIFHQFDRTSVKDLVLSTYR